MRKFISSPFYTANEPSLTLIAIFFIMNFVVLYNSCFHNPAIGYDSSEHIKYIQALSELRMPKVHDSYEFFSPPLAYIFPAVLKSVSSVSIYATARFALLLNFLYSILTTFFLLKIGETIQPEKMTIRIGMIGLLGMLPVYYKTYSFIRGEPLLTALTAYIAYKTLSMLWRGDNEIKTVKTIDCVIYGMGIGLSMLTRQLAFFLIISVIGFWALIALRNPLIFKSVAVMLFKSMCVAVLVSCCFYLYMKFQYGSFKTYLRVGEPHFSLSNQEKSFYLGTGNNQLFLAPVRPAFPNQFLPIIYSETWGDYWGFFLVMGFDAVNRTYLPGGPLWNRINSGNTEGIIHNRDKMSRYLARTNIVGLIPSVLMMFGAILGFVSCWKLITSGIRGKPILAKKIEDVSVLSMLILIVGFAGYMWFLIMYPYADGDTIKASYILHLFPFMCILGSIAMSILEEKCVLVYKLLYVILIMCFVHNIPAYLSRYL